MRLLGLAPGGLYQAATQTVFGEGPADARVMLVGEQPGDEEDVSGRPFVGPAGRLLDEVLREVEIDRRLLYVTNAVKHFKFEPRGKRRVHSKPAMPEIRACSAWLRAEVEAVGPRMIVCLGASAAQSFMGPGFRLLARRGEVFADTGWAPWWMATYHPSALLRMPEESAREEARRAFTEDLRRVAEGMGRRRLADGSGSVLLVPARSGRPSRPAWTLMYGSPMTAARPCIAIINDYWDFINILAVHFEQRGYRAVGARVPDLAKDGVHGAVHFLEEHDPDVIIFDVAPPFMEHIRYLESFRKAEARKGRKFVITTTWPLAVSGYRCTDGIVALFDKPFRIEALVAAVENALKERGRAA